MAWWVVGGGAVGEGDGCRGGGWCGCAQPLAGNGAAGAGGRASVLTGHTLVVGSSPPTRGARPAGHHRRIHLGIIPADAGSTWTSTPAIAPPGSSPPTRGARQAVRERDQAVLDHPRLRGEHASVTGVRPDIQGSSPPTRGARGPRHRPEVPRRIISAYAGSTSAQPRTWIGIWDHPRLRGEHKPCVTYLHVAPGSSPPTRGAHPLEGGRGAGRRIIPAYAGSTCIRHTQVARPGDHPRLRGEHSSGTSNSWPVSGSSPPTRGALLVRGRQRAHGRIIPAYAGSTSPAPPSPSRQEDHPRLRGEHESDPHGRATLAGSSPPTRGAPRRRPTPSGPTADHPRLRGEHMVQLGPLRKLLGSSPPTRGALSRPPRHHSRHGIIPAYAGSTSDPAGPSPARRDHPRLRGEHSSVGAAMSGHRGSSPPTRGARRWLGLRRRCGGIIPAYAGSTR